MPYLITVSSRDGRLKTVYSRAGTQDQAVMNTLHHGQTDRYWGPYVAIVLVIKVGARLREYVEVDPPIIEPID